MNVSMVTFLTAAFTVIGMQNSIAEPTLQSQPATEAVFFSKIYVPNGFDSNDHVQFVGEGTFGNSCYRPSSVSVVVDSAKKTVTVGPIAYKYNGLCLQLRLPFDRTIDVGILGAGTWSVVQLDGKQIGQIKISPTLTADPDDYLYAPISQAYIHEVSGQVQLSLDGTFPNSCMTLQDVKVDVQDDVIVVQPIAQISQDSACAGAPAPFSKTINIGNVKAGHYLLHVRSMNAQAINSMVNLQ